MDDNSPRGVLLIAEPPAVDSTRLDFYEMVLQSASPEIELSFSFNSSNENSFELAMLDIGTSGDHSKQILDGLVVGTSIMGFYRNGFYIPDTNPGLEARLTSADLLEFPDYGNGSVSLILDLIRASLIKAPKQNRFQSPKEKIIIDLDKIYGSAFIGGAIDISPRTVLRWFGNGLSSIKGEVRDHFAKGDNLLHFFAENNMYQYLGEKNYSIGEVARMVGVTSNSANKWFDNEGTNDPKYLRGFKLPNSQERRIPERRLQEFLTHYGIIDYLGESVYSSGKLAKIFKCAPRTVCKLMSVGKLGGYNLPFSQDRRFPHSEVLKYVRGDDANPKYRDNFRNHITQE
jgi:hypothetical protein